VLIRRGKYEPGSSLLQQGFVGAGDDQAKASVSAFMALAYHQLHQDRLANRWLAKAHRLDSSSEVLPVVRKRIASMRADESLDQQTI
jgi:hypothetical protein